MYNFKEHIGSGNFGDVYLYENPKTKTLFVAKIEKKNSQILTKECYYLRTLQTKDDP